MFRKSFETSLIISSEIIKFARKIVLCKSFSQIFQNTANFFYLNFISVNFHKNQRNFLDRSVHNHSLRSRLSGEGRRSQVHPPLAQSVQEQSFKQKGLGAHGFGAERARLVVQVKKLSTRLRHITCKTSRSSRKPLCTRLRRRTCKTSRASKKALHPASAQNVQDQSFKQKGLVTHGFGTECARLVVQVKKLCNRLWLSTCKTSRSSRKAQVHTATAQNVQDQLIK